MNYRNYVDCSNHVKNNYKNMFENQTLDYVSTLVNNNCNIKTYDIKYIIDKQNEIYDESDPDTEQSQIIHAYQTAESINKKYFNDDDLKIIYIKDLFTTTEWNQLPDSIIKLYSESNTINNLFSHIKDWKWLQIIGFIHDIGKILVLSEFGNFPQWSAVGDIYPVGCEFSESNILYNKKYHMNNNDYSKYDKLGIYQKNCGLENLYMTFSHDYYLYQILKQSDHKIPDEGLYMIRFHSFYAWHTPRNVQRGYTYFANEYDWKMLPLLKILQNSDLYSKINILPNIAKLNKKYFKLLQEYQLNKLNIPIYSYIKY